jgi:hypothetical protein
MIKLQLHPDQKMLTQFAWVSPVGFLAFGWLFHKFGLGDTVLWCTAALGPVVLLAHLVGLRAFPLFMFRALVVLTFPLGFVLFPILLGVIYYGVFTPMGGILRLTGRDAMGKKIDRNAPTYWRNRGAQPPASSYFKLY